MSMIKLFEFAAKLKILTCDSSLKFRKMHFKSAFFFVHLAYEA